MIQEIRDMQARLAALERSQQRPTQEIRDDGDLRLRWGRQPDGAYTVRAHDAGGGVLADLLGLGPIVTSLPAGPTAGQVCRYRHATGQPPWLCIWDPELNSGAGAWSVHGAMPLLSLSEGADRSTSSTTLTTIAGMPLITIPVAGIWRLEWGAIWQHTAVGGWAILAVSPATDNASAREQATAAASWARLARHRSAAVSLSAGTITPVARTVSGTVTFRDIDLSATPLELRP